MHLPNPPPPSLTPEQEAQLPLTDLHKDLLGFHSRLHSSQKYEFGHIKNQGQFSEAAQSSVNHYFSSVRAWQNNLPIHVVLKSAGDRCEYGSVFHINYKNPKYTQIKALNISNFGDLCLTVGQSESVDVRPCLVTDRNQWWSVEGDTTVRPYSGKDMCLTVVEDSGPIIKGSVSLTQCNQEVFQSWSWFSSHSEPVPDEMWGTGTFQWGWDVLKLCLESNTLVSREIKKNSRDGEYIIKNQNIQL